MTPWVCSTKTANDYWNQSNLNKNYVYLKLCLVQYGLVSLAPLCISKANLRFQWDRLNCWWGICKVSWNSIHSPERNYIFIQINQNYYIAILHTSSLKWIHVIWIAQVLVVMHSNEHTIYRWDFIQVIYTNWKMTLIPIASY